MASFYRKFVSGFSAIAKPLNELLRKEANVARDWTTTRRTPVEGEDDFYAGPLSRPRFISA